MRPISNPVLYSIDTTSNKSYVDYRHLFLDFYNHTMSQFNIKRSKSNFTGNTIVHQKKVNEKLRSKITSLCPILYNKHFTQSELDFNYDIYMFLT